MRGREFIGLERPYGGSDEEDLMAGRDWRIEGKYVEYCSCDLGCPCESMADPTYGICTGLVAFKIDKGHCEKLSLDGLAVVATFYFPRAIHHGQGVLQPIIDERANDAQRDALFYILSGEDQKAGTMFQIFSTIMRRSRTRSSRTSPSNGTRRSALHASRCRALSGPPASRSAIR
jgi:hypothetical protein